MSEESTEATDVETEAAEPETRDAAADEAAHADDDGEA